ncbi:hypothetical protein BSKO_04363 [Bryopsis sp. KO-2023]|nr:hypothetical protein BSKO_04363 [Bryopsis sp. KO-2023]
MSRATRSSGLDLLRDESSRYASASSRASIAAQGSDSDESFWDDHEAGVKANLAEGSEVVARKSQRGGSFLPDVGVFSTKTVPEELAGEVMSLLEHVGKSEEVPKEALETILAQVSNSQGGDDADALMDYLNKVATSLYDHPIQPTPSKIIPVEEKSNEPETPQPETSGDRPEPPKEKAADIIVQVFPTNQSLVEARFRERAGKSSNTTSDSTRPSTAISSKSRSEMKGSSGKFTGPPTCLSEIKETLGMDHLDNLVILPMSKAGDAGCGDGQEEEIVDLEGENLIMGECPKTSCPGSLHCEKIDAQTSQLDSSGKKNSNAGCDHPADGKIGAKNAVGLEGKNDDFSESRLVTMASMVASAATAAVTTAISKLNIGNINRDPWRHDPDLIGGNSRQPSRPPTRQAQIVHTSCNGPSKADKIGEQQVKIEHRKEAGADISTQTSDLSKFLQSGLPPGGGMRQDCYNIWQRDDEDQINKKNQRCVGGSNIVERSAEVVRSPVGMPSISGEAVDGMETRRCAEPVKKVELPGDLKDSIFRAMEDLNNLATGVPTRPIARFSVDLDDHQETVRCLNTTLGGKFDYSAVRNQLNSLRSGSELLNVSESATIASRKIRSDAPPPAPMWAGIQTWKDMQAFQKGVRQEVEHRMNTPHKLVLEKHPKPEEKKNQSSLKLAGKPYQGGKQQETLDMPAIAIPTTAAGLTQSQRLRRKRGTPEPPSVGTPKRQPSRFPEKPPPRPSSPVNKKPCQRPRIAFGSRVAKQLENPKSTPPKSTPLNRTRPPPEPMARRISQPPRIPSPPYQRGVGKSKVEKDARSIAESSCADTEDLLVDGIMEALMRAARGFEVKKGHKAGPTKEVKQVDSPQRTTGRIEEIRDCGTEVKTASRRSQPTYPGHRIFLSVSDMREPPLANHQVKPETPACSSEVQDGCQNPRVTRSVNGAVEEWLVDEALARLMMQTTSQAQQSRPNRVVNLPDVPADSPALAALAVEGLSQEMENIWKGQPKESQADTEQPGLDGLDDNILKILVDALVEARISEQEPNRGQTPEPAAVHESTPAPTPVPLSNEHLPKPIAYQSEAESDVTASVPKPLLKVVIPEAAPQSLQTTIQVAAPMEGLPATQCDTSELAPVAASTPFIQSCTGTPMLSPHPRKPLTIKPHSDLDASGSSDSGPAARSSDRPHTATSESTEYTEASTPEKSQTEAPQPPSVHSATPSEASSIHAGRQNTTMLANLAVSMGHGVFEVSAARIDRTSDVSIPSPMASMGESSAVPISQLGEGGDTDSAGPKPTLPRYLPPGPPPGHPMSLHQFCGGGRRLWRPPPQEESGPPSASDFYGSAEDSSSTDSHGTKVNIAKNSRCAGPPGFRLNQYRARRRYLMEKAGIDDPLLMSSSSSLGSGTSSETSDDRSLRNAAAIHYKNTFRDVEFGNCYPGGGDLGTDV